MYTLYIRVCFLCCREHFDARFALLRLAGDRSAECLMAAVRPEAHGGGGGDGGGGGSLDYSTSWLLHDMMQVSKSTINLSTYSLCITTHPFN